MSNILGRDKVLQLLQDTLGYATADQTEIVFSGSHDSLTRFANNYIHQNVSESNTSVRIRSIFGQKIGSASTNNLDLNSLKATLAMAETLAKLQVADPDFKSLPGAGLAHNSHTVATDFDTATYFSEPQTRADGAGAVCRRAIAAGFVAAGAVETNGHEVAVVNSLGLTNYALSTSSHINTVVMGQSGSGWGERLSPRIGDIDFEAVAAEAVDKAVRSQNPQSLPAGEYEVILEEYAVAEMLSYMAYLGMGALAVQEERSFMRLGEQIASPLVSITDDVYDPRVLNSPFDTEGVSRTRLVLIEAGVAKAVAYDSYTADKEAGRVNTGHSIGDHGEVGPIPTSLVMTAGQTSKAAMLKGIKRGLWVTRFHYVNPLVPDKAVLTGMTRDGTFLIENGEIVGPVKNFRFTHSAVEALNDVLEVGNTQMLLPLFGGCSLVPALHCKRFTFNSSTEF